MILYQGNLMVMCGESQVSHKPSTDGMISPLKACRCCDLPKRDQAFKRRKVRAITVGKMIRAQREWATE